MMIKGSKAEASIRFGQLKYSLSGPMTPDPTERPIFETAMNKVN